MSQKGSSRIVLRDVIEGKFRVLYTLYLIGPRSMVDVNVVTFVDDSLEVR
jgi:hypothetical protein